MLSTVSKQQLIRQFPDVKLSYDRVLHRKVSADIYFVIPKGPKAFIWITYHDRKRMAVVLSLDAKGSIRKVTPVILAFSNKLALGTIMYGTQFQYNGHSCFCIEDMHFLEGRNIEYDTMASKLEALESLFVNTKQSKYCEILIGAPVMTSNCDEAHRIATELPYRVYGIQCHSLKGRNGPIGTYLVKANPCHKAIFRVRATLEADIYELLSRVGVAEKVHGFAMIPTYKCSVMMNDKFRNIKENHNLDRLEESDDEDEFEDVSLDKFVDLNKSLVMECVYMSRFKKWCPDKIIENREITEHREVISLEKK